MPITKASYDKANSAMGVIQKSYSSLQLAQVTIQETQQQFAPPGALKAIWQQDMDNAIATVKEEVGTW